MLHVVRPLVIRWKNGEIGRLAGGDFAFEAEDPRRAGGEKFNQTHERETTGVDELLERERERGLEAEDSEGSAVELDVLERGLVRGMVGGDGVDGAIGETGE